MNTLRVPFKKTQRGATLVIALLLMVMIAMYGIPAAMNSMQNERMTGNTRQRDLAFQAAEHTLRLVENSWFLAQSSTALDALAPAAKKCSDTPDDADPVAGDGILPNGECHDNDAAYWRDTFDWAAGKSPSESPISAPALDLVYDQPLYVVERMPSVCKNPAAPSSPPTPPPCSTPSVENHYYRITARGVGQDSNAIVILQTMYAFEPSPP